MKRVAQAPNIAIAQLWLDHLAANGIAATMQRRFASSIAGDLPPDQALPELWVQDDTQFAAARAALAALAQIAQRHWLCVACGEQIEGGFDSCWSCGAWMPGAAPHQNVPG
jgi:hypothetical protein